MSEAEVISIRPAMVSVVLHAETRIRAEFENAIRTILERHGRPIDKYTLFEAFKDQYSELNNTDKVESFRIRLWRLRHVIRFDTLVNGYWFVDKPMSWPVVWHPPEPVAALPKVLGPFQHYGVLAEDCGCPLCIEWRAWRDASAKVSLLIENHERGCVCVGCKEAHRTRLNFLAVENRRNLWSEVSYHIAHGELPYQPVTVMGRLKGILEDRSYTANWWAIAGGQYPMGYWFRKLTAGLEAVSGMSNTLRATG